MKYLFYFSYTDLQPTDPKCPKLMHGVLMMKENVCISTYTINI